MSEIIAVLIALAFVVALIIAPHAWLCPRCLTVRIRRRLGALEAAAKVAWWVMRDDVFVLVTYDKRRKPEERVHYWLATRAAWDRREQDEWFDWLTAKMAKTRGWRVDEKPNAAEWSRRWER